MTYALKMHDGSGLLVPEMLGIPRKDFQDYFLFLVCFAVVKKK